MRFIWLLIGMLLISACGFTPVYGVKNHKPGQSAPSVLLASVAISPIKGKMGQTFKGFIEDKFDPTAVQYPTLYDLQVELQKHVVPFSVEKDRRVTRYTVDISTQYKLIRRSDKAVVAKGAFRSNGSYDALGSRFSTYIAEEDTTNNLLRELAEELKLSIIASLLRLENGS